MNESPVLIFGDYNTFEVPADREMSGKKGD
jgi:hypothetical protein